MYDHHVYVYRRHTLLKALGWLKSKKMTRMIKKLQWDLFKLYQQQYCFSFTYSKV